MNGGPKGHCQRYAPHVYDRTCIPVSAVPPWTHGVLSTLIPIPSSDGMSLQTGKSTTLGNLDHYFLSGHKWKPTAETAYKGDKPRTIKSSVFPNIVCPKGIICSLLELKTIFRHTSCGLSLSLYIMYIVRFDEQIHRPAPRVHCLVSRLVVSVSLDLRTL